MTTSPPDSHTRFKFLAATFAVPFWAFFLIGAILLAHASFGQRDFTASTTHRFDGTQADFASLRARITAMQDFNDLNGSVNVERTTAPHERCGPEAARMTATFRAHAFDTEGTDRYLALVQNASHTGLGPACTGLHIEFGSPEIRSQELTLAFAAVGMLIPFLIWISRNGRRPFGLDWADWQLRTSRRTAIRESLLFTLLAIVCALVIGVINHHADGLGELARPRLGASMSLTLYFLAICFAPFFEEFLFRAWLLERLTRVTPVVVALSVSVAAFVAVHVPRSLFEVIALSTLGIILSWLWLRTRSLSAIVLSHALYNTFAVGFTLMGE